MKNNLRSISRIIFLILFTGLFMLSPLMNSLNAAPKSLKELRSPVRIAFGPGNNLLVSDYNTKAIFTIDRNKNKILKGFSIKGRPLGVAYLKGRIFVGNNTSKKVEVYAESGKLKYSFDGTIKKPNDIAIDETGERAYVVDSTSKSVNIYDIAGHLLFKITQNLHAPAGIAIDNTNGLIYVSDYGNPSRWKYPSIQAYDFDGNPVGSISGKLGMMGNRFSRPQGLAIDGNGYVFMVDCYSAEIMVFSGLSGILIKTMSGFGSGPGRMKLPYDLVLNPRTKDIFVTNNRESKVEIFRNGGKL